MRPARIGFMRRGRRDEERTSMLLTRCARPLAAVAALLMLAAIAAASASADPAGKTTLSETIRIAPGTGFHQLVAGPGEPFITRPIAQVRAGKRRAAERRSLLFFGQGPAGHHRAKSRPARAQLPVPAG